MIIKIRKNVVCEIFDNKEDMMKKIIIMIFNSKTEKILYKGNPNEISYKTMKKAIVKGFDTKIDSNIVHMVERQI